MRYADRNQLYVSCALIENKLLRNGVERYLFDRLEPIVGSRAPEVEPIKANLPF